PRWRMAGGSLTDDGRSQELAALVEHGLFDHLVRSQQQRRRDRQAERLRRLEVDDQLELRRLLDGKVGGLGASKDLVYVTGDTAIEFSKHRSVSHQPSSSRDLAPFVHRCDASSRGHFNDPLVLSIEAREGGNEEGIDLFLGHGFKSGVVASRARHVGHVELDLRAWATLRTSVNAPQPSPGLRTATLLALGIASKSSSRRLACSSAGSI